MTVSTINAALVAPFAMTLGEGPCWVVRDAALWFVDIKRGHLHRHDPVSGATETIAVGGRPSFVVPHRGGGLLVGDGGALRMFDGATLSDPLATIAMPAHNRTNDATVAPDGRLWFGTMDDQERAATGAVHVWDGADIVRAGGACTITNGPAISPDGRYLYHVDTLARAIWRFDLTNGDALIDGELFIAIAADDGNPDGVTIDSEGCLWVALWGGWSLRRYSAAGALLLRIAMPCANVTKVAFGGHDLTTGYVTTARAGLSEAALADQPLAGALFAFPAPAPGIAGVEAR